MSEEAKTEAQKRDIEANRDVAAFSYFLILSPVILFTRRDSAFIQFHARQATVLFVLLIIIAQFPGRLSYLNFLTVALAITGLFQANQGRFWRTPVIAQALEAGVTADSLWQGMVRVAHTIKRAFVRESKKTLLTAKADSALKVTPNADLTPLTALIAEQDIRLSELEKEVLITRYLSGQHWQQLAEETKEEVMKIASKLRPLTLRHQPHADDTVLELFDRKSGKELLIGDLQPDGLRVAAPFFTASEWRCGIFRVRALKIGDHAALDDLIDELKNLPEAESKTQPDSPVNGLA